ncbi:group I intron-associated PD-(D/E)XK endonuclease [Bacillus sp. JJ1127]|uniref:group I intron-associated PD-(D/E)XK endonuclease n=1 Tax=Bacillus sp. JJ1127 TaxID=3122952 RepID=UPI003F68B1B9
MRFQKIIIICTRCICHSNCIYCPQTDLCYYFDPKSFYKSISLRIDPPKNYQEKNVHFADYYRELP